MQSCFAIVYMRKQSGEAGSPLRSACDARGRVALLYLVCMDVLGGPCCAAVNQQCSSLPAAAMCFGG